MIKKCYKKIKKLKNVDPGKKYFEVTLISEDKS